MGGHDHRRRPGQDSVPVKVRDGVHVGNWKTFVKGLYIDTFALGGDSAVRRQGGSPAPGGRAGDPSLALWPTAVPTCSASSPRSTPGRKKQPAHPRVFDPGQGYLRQPAPHRGGKDALRRPGRRTAPSGVRRPPP